ncbi:CHASE3 domain-containing protein, partial [Methylobacterium sp. J-059]|uniref:CHASE3 domain-containing protein n=1 Tax=Methylobacterium sp. J-059 TaxID=2836643 RepID=UPI001FBA4BDD
MRVPRNRTDYRLRSAAARRQDRDCPRQRPIQSDLSSLEPYRAGRPALDQTITPLRTLIGNDPERSRLFADAVTAARVWQTDIGETAIRQAADLKTRPDGVRIEAEGRGKQFFDTLRSKLIAIDNLEEQTRAAQAARVTQAERNESLALWGAALITLLICIGIGIAINRVIVRPLGRVMTFVEQVGQGDLSGTLGD